MFEESDTMEISDQRRHPFYIIDNDLIKVYGPQIGAYGVAIYSVLAMYADRDDEAWPSYQTIANHLSISRPTVIETIKVLTNIGLVAKDLRHGTGTDHLSNRYTLVDLHTEASKPDLPASKPDLPAPGKPRLPASKPDLPAPGKPRLPRGKPRLPEQEPMNKNQLEQDPRNKKKGGATAPDPLSAGAGDEDFVPALCWCWHEHKEPEILPRKSQMRLQIAADKLLTSGYTIDELRAWFRDKWIPDWRWQNGKQRPTPEQICESLPAIRSSRYEGSTYWHGDELEMAHSQPAARSKQARQRLWTWTR